MQSRQIRFVATVFMLTMLSMIVFSGCAMAEELGGLVGRWTFDDGTGKDLSSNGNDAVLGGGKVYSLGKGRACIQFTG